MRELRSEVAFDPFNKGVGLTVGKAGGFMNLEEL